MAIWRHGALVYNRRHRAVARTPCDGSKMADSQTNTHQVTQLLVAWGDGNKAALDQLIPLVYDELRRLARHYMRREREGHTLQTTALVNEAYLRLINQDRANWQNRAHFFGVAAQLMRRILVDHARTRRRAKREGAAQKVSLDEAALVATEQGPDLLAIHEALEKLEAMNARMGRIVELRFFGGLSIEEAAEVLKIAPGTVMKDWTLAKAFLHQAISDES